MVVGNVMSNMETEGDFETMAEFSIGEFSSLTEELLEEALNNECVLSGEKRIKFIATETKNSKFPSALSRWMEC